MYFHLQAGSCAALREAGCKLVGGHSTEGAAGDASSVLGFSVVGTLEAPNGLRSGGLPRGSAVVLTKALGVGVLLAAEARREVAGSAVAGALQQMAVSNGPAAECLMRRGATACTDVTGYIRVRKYGIFELEHPSYSSPENHSEHPSYLSLYSSLENETSEPQDGSHLNPLANVWRGQVRASRPSAADGARGEYRGAAVWPRSNAHQAAYADSDLAQTF